jgi:hypothetical protein
MYPLVLILQAVERSKRIFSHLCLALVPT